MCKGSRFEREWEPVFVVVVVVVVVFFPEVEMQNIVIIQHFLSGKVG